MPTGTTTKQRFCRGCDKSIGQASAQKWCSPECRRKNYKWDSTHAKCIKCEVDNKYREQSYCLKCSQYRNHNLTRDDVEFMKLLQGNRCPICEKILTEDFQIDHDHKCCNNIKSRSCGKCVRGLLCRTCNTALGKFKDDPRILRNAINFIQRNI